MDTKIKNFIRYYYKVNDFLPFSPFLVAPLEGFQDTIIFGPLSLTKNHDSFINQLYSKTPRHEINDYILRLFLYNNHLILALILPLSIRDEAERKGLALSLGVMADTRLPTHSANILFEYFKSFINLINETFRLSLPEEDSQKLIEIIRNPSQYQHKIENLVYIMLSSSQIINGLMKSCGLKKRRLNKFLKARNKSNIPKVIICPENITFNDILEIVIKETIKFISKEGVLATEKISQNEFLDKDIIIIYKLPKSLLKIKKIEIEKSGKNKYICIF